MKLQLSILIVILFSIYSCSNEIKKETSGYSFTEWKADSDGNKIEKSQYKVFDEKDNLVKWIQYWNGTEHVDSFVYVYQAEVLTKKLRYVNGQLFSQTIFEYNENNKIETEKELNRDNELESYLKHFYLSDNVETIENYDKSDELYSIDSLKYDSKGNLIEETQYLSDGFWFQHHTYEYDINDNLIIQKSEANPEFDGVGIVEYHFDYNSENKRVSKRANVPDTGLKYYIYEYGK